MNVKGTDRILPINILARDDPYQSYITYQFV